MDIQIPKEISDLIQAQQELWRMNNWMDQDLWRTTTNFESFQNWVLDVLFYNVRRVPSDLWNECTFQKSPENSIILLTRAPRPGGVGRQFKLSSYKQLEHIPKEDLGRVKALALAGVGSSALGAVALAVDVADTISDKLSEDEVTVAAIVTGDGYRGVLWEALGGYYGLGKANIGRQRLLTLSDAAKVWLDRSFGIPAKISDQMDLFALMARNTAINCPESKLVAEFLHSAAEIKLVVGHSKGSLYLNNALCRLSDAARKTPDAKAKLEDIAARITIVTLGAVIFSPPEFDDCIHQFLGEYDMLGKQNSRSRVKYTVIPGVAHHLNTAIPMHMDCYKILSSRGIL